MPGEKLQLPREVMKPREVSWRDQTDDKASGALTPSRRWEGTEETQGSPHRGYRIQGVAEIIQVKYLVDSKRVPRHVAKVRPLSSLRPCASLAPFRPF